MSNELAMTYTTMDDQELTVTAEDVKNVLGAPTATLGEVRLFLELCKARKLNPFLGEAYIVKYGNNPATILTGKEVFTKRAAKNPRFQGFKAGVTIVGNDGALNRREGSMKLPGETLIGGWAEVYLDGYQVPIKEEVSLDEYMGRKKDGTANSQWATRPATMIRKVALVHALREAFPEDLGGLYDATEIDTGNVIEAQPIDVKPPKKASKATTKPSQPNSKPIAKVSRPDSNPTETVDKLATLRSLMREASSLGVRVKDDNDPSVGLMGWIRATYRREPQELTPVELKQAEAYVANVINDARQVNIEPPAEEYSDEIYEAEIIEEAPLLPTDIEF